MAKKMQPGICRLCGEERMLSFEHVPPEAAFNDHRVLLFSFDKFLAAENLDEMRGGHIQQRGVGAHTLCVQCNNDTGAWYGSAYADWASQAMQIIIGTRGKPTLEYPFNLYPLRVLKQVVCMFFSVNGPAFQARHSDLVRFVLDKESRDFPRDVRIYAFYTFANRMRMAGVSGAVTGLGTSRSQFHIFSEITFPPFGFVLSFEGLAPPAAVFCEISGFSRFSYMDWRDGIIMKLPLMPIFTGFPGDYRTRDKTLADFQESMERAAQCDRVP
jgi:hypothetical protein